ncbi:MAG: COR domain-containing protein [Mariniphaga sp.]
MNIQWKEFSDSGFISFYDNPIENVPIEILKQGKAAIKAWFAANKKKLNEIKVLLVGDAEAGKTSICKRLNDNTFDKHEKQTDGIKIEKLVFGDLPTFSQQTQLHGLSAYLWDFGGQEIMTSTHRFFLTNRSVYILVLEARNDKSTETQIRKWLENITTQGGNSPVIIAVNKIDVNPAFDIDKYNLKKEFPQITGFVRISCEKDENLHELKRLLETAIPHAELFNTEIDERWLKIKEDLQEKTKANFKLNESEYLEICIRHELTNHDEQNQCVRFLHDLGIILHFDKMDLGEYYILDPLWVTTGVYRIITSEKAANASGVVPYEELREIANTTKGETETDEYCRITYTNFESRYLADIMEEFKLCFFASQKKLMLIPDLFKKETPAVEVEKIIHSTEKLEFIYDYPFLHHSVISRLIVAINGEITTFWRSGVITTSKSLNATCLVRAFNDQIQITVTGDKKDKRQYLSQIRYFVNQINEEFKLKPTLLIPLVENTFVEYIVLVEMEREGEKTYRDYKLKKTYQISRLLEGIESNEEILRQSTSIINNYNTINVTGMDNKVVQAATDSKFNFTDNTIPSIENSSEIHNLELLYDKKNLENELTK